MPKKSSNKNTGSPSFETNLQRLEEIVEHLESGEKSLDEVVTMFEEGIRLSTECMQYLDKTELRLKKLSKDAEGKFELSTEDEGE
ncbi:MAG TPA: exodeoxyribonuclease VII small subunit [Bacteroidota bacterium]|nr:exodeoxyribonuclease VII small subunit [Bacteroidota bacterium]